MKILKIAAVIISLFSLSFAFAQSADTAVILVLTNRSDSLTEARNLKMAFRLCDSALRQAREIKSIKWEAYALNYKGNLYNYLDDVNNSLTFYDAAIKLYEKTGHRSGLAASWLNKGNVYFGIGEYKKAESCYLKSERLITDLKNKDKAAAVFNNLGSVYGSLGEYGKARDFFLKAKKIYEEQKDSVSIGYYYNNIAYINTSEGNHAAALENMNTALFFKLSKGTSIEKSVAYRNLASAYSDLGDYSHALENMRQALKLTDTAVYNDHLKVIYRDLATYLTEVGNYREASLYYRKLQDVNAEIVTRDIAAQMEQKDLLSEISKMHLADSIKKVTEIEKQRLEIEKSNSVKYSLLAIILLIAVFSLIIFRRYRISQQQKKVISYQKHLVDEKQKEILDSMNYARKIQKTLLHDEAFLKAFPSSFVIFKPKDIVSGDFYWSCELNEKGYYYLAVCDSTGHGVPGAFMSVMNISFISEAINEKNITEPDRIFNYVREKLISIVGKENQKDGFDGVLLRFDSANNTIVYAAANSSPFLVSGGTAAALSCDKMPVGQSVKMNDFSLFSIEIKKGGMLYLYSDGYADQFGGGQNKKFMSKRMKEIFIKTSGESPEKQKQIIEQMFMEWKGNYEQVDDVTVVGIRF
jgi:serine phosphatase RsbU (regulator of sigma subunit)